MILALGLPGCGSAQGPADGAPKITARTGMRNRPQHAARPVAVKLGSTFEVRVRFRRRLPANADGTGAGAEFSLGPSTTDHAPVRMRGSRGFCYRQTLYNDLDKPSLRQAHAGSTLTLTLTLTVRGGRRPLVRRVKLSADRDAVPPGCVLHRASTG
jgi:hypothetical protein